MTYMLTHVLIGVKPIDNSLAYVSLSQHNIEGAKTAAQGASVTLEAITFEVNAKCHKLLSMCLDKFNDASC